MAAVPPGSVARRRTLKRRKSLGFVLDGLRAIAPCGPLPGPASAAPTVDHEQPTIDTSSGFVFGIGGGSEQKLAQVFTSGVTGNLTEVDLSLACEGNLTIQIQGASGGKPNGVILGTLVTAAPVPFPSTFRSFVRTSTVSVTAAPQYA